MDLGDCDEGFRQDYSENWPKVVEYTYAPSGLNAASRYTPIPSYVETVECVGANNASLKGTIRMVRSRPVANCELTEITQLNFSARM